MLHTTSAPAVSIILPTYNRREYLSRAITSVLRQSYSDFELIVVDDGSSDGTDALIAAMPDSRIVYLQCPINRGQSVARNIGIRSARAPLVAFQDSDDEWLPDKLAAQVAVLNLRPSVAMIYGDLLHVPLFGEPFTIAAPELAVGQVFDDRSTLYASYGIGIQTCLIRRDVLIALAGFEERLRKLEDLELFLRISRHYEITRLARVLVRYFETTGVSRQNQHINAARHLLLRRHALRMLQQKPIRFLRELTILTLGWPTASPL